MLCLDSSDRELAKDWKDKADESRHNIGPYVSLNSILSSIRPVLIPFGHVK